MKQLTDILNLTGDFNCNISGENVSFAGTLSSCKENVILQCRMDIEHYQKIDPYSSLRIWGTVDSIPVTLLDVYTRSGQYGCAEAYVYLTLDPSEIVIGRSYPDIASVTQISMSISALNNMFSTCPLKSVHRFSNEQPAVLNYSFPGTIEANDKYGHLRIYQSFQEKWSRNEISYKILPIIEYEFIHPVDVMDAVAKIAAVRNLFTFFANYYLPLEKIQFVDLESESSGAVALYDCSLYLNHREDIPAADEPFLIMISSFSENFEVIWKKWLQVYEESKSIPTLFYEIICNRSTRINRFLNLAQAIEVYSCKYRETDVKEIVKKYGKPKSGKQPLVCLKHRLEDVLSLLNPCLDIDTSKISVLAESLADMRNFYTHYNEKRLIEPSYQEMLAACHILEFVLLAMIYNRIGISDECIKSDKVQ